MSKVIAVVLLAAVEIGGSFGNASATIESISSTSMTIDLEVEVVASAQSVVAHLAFRDDPNITLPLLDRGDGKFGIRTELEPKNYLVFFEAIGDPDGLSRAVSLIEMGADFSPDGSGDDGSGQDDDGLSTETRQAGWLALALAAGALSALAFWVLGGRDRNAEPADEEE